MCVASIVNSQNSPARSWRSPTYPTYLKGSSKAVGKSQIVVVNKYESAIYGTKFHSICESFIFFVHLDRVEQFRFTLFFRSKIAFL